MKLSIITINYNNFEGLRRTVDSVMSQTWRDFEWILVDGGSTDGSKELIEEIAANPDSNISWWCSEPDKGIYNAMNKGIAHAKGEYLNFMNSGDYYYSASILNQFFSLVGTKLGIDVFYGDHIRYDGKMEKILKSPELFAFSTLLKYGMNHQASFISRALFEKEQYDESLKIVSDWKMFVKWMLSGKHFQYVALTICYFEGGGLCTTNEKMILQEKEIVLSSLLSSNIAIDIQELESYKVFEEVAEIRNLIAERRLFRRIFRISICLVRLLKKIGL